MVELPGLLDITRESDEPLCIRFVNTVGWRTSDHPTESLNTGDDLGRWLVIQRLVEQPPKFEPASFGEALALRECQYSVLSSLANRHSALEADLLALTSWVSRSCRCLAFSLHEGRGTWTVDQGNPAERALCLTALSAALLLSSDNVERLRLCADPSCGWVFLDHSKNHSRKWCDMSDCGNRAKARRYQARKRRSRT